MNPVAAQAILLEAVKQHDQKLLRMAGAMMTGLQRPLAEAENNLAWAQDNLAFALAQIAGEDVRPSVTADQAQLPSSPNLGLTRRSSGDET